MARHYMIYNILYICGPDWLRHTEFFNFIYICPLSDLAGDRTSQWIINFYSSGLAEVWCHLRAGGSFLPGKIKIFHFQPSPVPWSPHCEPPRTPPSPSGAATWRRTPTSCSWSGGVGGSAGARRGSRRWSSSPEVGAPGARRTRGTTSTRRTSTWPWRGWGWRMPGSTSVWSTTSWRARTSSGSQQSVSSCPLTIKTPFDADCPQRKWDFLAHFTGVRWPQIRELTDPH